MENYAKVMGVQFPKITLDRTVDILSNSTTVKMETTAYIASICYTCIII